uniref:Uncharacterized protein n=1 Tax=Anolis carolinensis TaxID=28377 RepID=A0A803SNI5_ANOCA
MGSAFGFANLMLRTFTALSRSSSLLKVTNAKVSRNFLTSWKAQHS